MPSGIKRTMSAAYVQDLYHLNNDTDITFGVRYGRYNDFGSTLNPRVALVHRFTNKFYSKLLYGEAFKPPAFSQLFDATPTQSQFRMRGNSKLAATEITSYEVQLGYDFSEKIKSNISVYQNSTLDEIFFDATPGIEQWRNSGERTFKGVELELKGAWLGLDYAFLNYSYQQTYNDGNKIENNIHPKHRLNTGGNYRLNDHLTTNFTVSYFSSGKRAINDLRKDMKSKLLLRLAVQTKNLIMSGLSLELSISNLLNQSAHDETENSLAILDDIPLEGRAMRFSFRYSF